VGLRSADINRSGAVGPRIQQIGATETAVGTPRATGDGPAACQRVIGARSSIGFSFGSALGGPMFSAYASGHGFQRRDGYVTASAVGAAIMLAAAVLVAINPARRS
jgi:hypothetical protein